MKRVLIDTDTANEIDDQFALAHAALSPGQISLDAVVAAPFSNNVCSDPAEAMRQSRDEALKVLELCSRGDVPVYAGSDQFMTGPEEPVESRGAQAIIEFALRPSKEPKLVLAIGAATNVASALLMEPNIADKVTIVWLGGHVLNWPDAREFNLQGDPYAARILLDRAQDLVMLPALGVTSHLLVSVPLLERDLEGSNPLGTYLTKIVREHRPDDLGAEKELWDVAATAFAINPDWVPCDVIHSPILTDDLHWRLDPTRHPIRIARWVQRNAIFADLFSKIRSIPFLLPG